jgi:hypothetical protein
VLTAPPIRARPICSPASAGFSLARRLLRRTHGTFKKLAAPKHDVSLPRLWTLSDKTGELVQIS